jgi:hypothetical protein
MLTRKPPPRPARPDRSAEFMRGAAANMEQT